MHGFMQFDGNFTITETASLDKAQAYKAVNSSTTMNTGREHTYDYKGIGGDVEVLSVVPMCIGSYVWEDKGELGTQDDEDIGLKGITVKLFDDQNNELNSTVTKDEGVYEFCNLPEGRYRVCVATPEADGNYVFGPTPIQTREDNNDSELDSNIAFVKDSFNCSGVYDLWANTEPIEKESAQGDDQDDNADKLGNMTVDFGFVKKIFDLALIKTVENKKDKYAIGDTVTFKITVKNQGDVNATDVVIKDTIPTGLDCSQDNNWSNGVLVRPIPLIVPDDESSVKISCEITEDVGEKGTIINVAEIESAKNPYDLNDTDSKPGENPCSTDMGNNDNYDGGTSDGCDDVDPAPIKIDQHFDLALVKFVKSSGSIYKPGDNVTFTIGVGNQGTLTGRNIQIRDIIPEGLELVEDSTWKLDGDEAVLKTPIPSLAPEANTTIDITFKIKEAFNGDKIVNIAEIKSAENDLNLTDDDSKPDHRDECTNDKDNNPDYADSGCDDEDPAVITVSKTNLSATPSTAATACDCAAEESDKVDAINLMGVALMLLVSLLMGVLAMRPRTSL